MCAVIKMCVVMDDWSSFTGRRYVTVVIDRRYVTVVIERKYVTVDQ